MVSKLKFVVWLGNSILAAAERIGPKLLPRMCTLSQMPNTLSRGRVVCPLDIYSSKLEVGVVPVFFEYVVRD